MSTPAQIRSERKKVLRTLKTQLKGVDSLTDKLERQIERVLKVKKRLPDSEDATGFLTDVRTIDKQFDKVITAATTFSNFVRTT